MIKKLRIIFAGTPEFGIPCLKALFASEHQIIATYTQPDRPSGRGRKLTQSAIKEWSLDNNIPVYQPLNFKEQDTIDALQKLNPDIIIVIAYGLILPTKVLNIPKFGCINVHASILPRWRGASPIQQAILNGDTKTGITIMQMDKGMDTGDFYQIATCDISSNDTTQTLHDKLQNIAVEPLLQTISAISNNSAIKIKQDETLVTYAPKINKIDAKINWHDSATNIHQKIRAFTPWPLAYIEVNDTNIKIIQADIMPSNTKLTPGKIISIQKEGILVSTMKDNILITKIKMEGKSTITIADYLNMQNQILQPGMTLL